MTLLASTAIHAVTFPLVLALVVLISQSIFGMQLRTITFSVTHPLPLRSVWVATGIVVPYGIVTSLLGYVSGKLVAPRLFSPLLPVWTVEIFERSQKTGSAITAYVVLKNGDRYVGLLRSIPHDYETLQGATKDFTLVKASYLPAGAADLQNLQGQTVLLNSGSVEAIHIIETPVDESR